MVSATFDREEYFQHNTVGFVAASFKKAAVKTNHDRFIDPLVDSRFKLQEIFFHLSHEEKQNYLNSVVDQMKTWKCENNKNAMSGLIFEFVEKTPELFDTVDKKEKSDIKHKVLQSLTSDTSDEIEWQLAIRLFKTPAFLDAMTGKARVQNWNMLVNAGLQSKQTAEQALKFGNETLLDEEFSKNFLGNDIASALQLVKAWPDEQQANMTSRQFNQGHIQKKFYAYMNGSDTGNILYSQSKFQKMNVGSDKLRL